MVNGAEYHGEITEGDFRVWWSEIFKMTRDGNKESGDLHDLSRFVSAQENAYRRALREITAGHKESHWMWFIFPQVAGLGTSDMARRYAISGLAEAEAYVAHPDLGTRLIECCEALLRIKGHSAHDIFGYPDDLKLRSSMTLFARVGRTKDLCQAVLDKYFGGKPDERTLQMLQRGERAPRNETLD